MAHWTIENEITDGQINDLIVFVDDKGLKFKTMFDALDFLHILKQGIPTTEKDNNIINFLANIYGIEKAIDVVTAFKFGGTDDKITAKFMLAPDSKETKGFFRGQDSSDILDLALALGFSKAKLATSLELTKANFYYKIANGKGLDFSEKYMIYKLINE